MLTNIIIGALGALAGAVIVIVYYTKVMAQLKTDLATARAHEQSLEREIRNTEEFAEAMGNQFKALAARFRVGFYKAKPRGAIPRQCTKGVGRRLHLSLARTRFWERYPVAPPNNAGEYKVVRVAGFSPRA